MSKFKSIEDSQELDARIHNFLERKTKRFPDLAKLEAEHERSGILVKVQSSLSDWFHPLPKSAH